MRLSSFCVPCAHAFRYRRLRSLPGYVDRSLTPAARVRLVVTWTAVLGGLGAGLMMVYRTFLRPSGWLSNLNGPWTSTILGRREL